MKRNNCRLCTLKVMSLMLSTEHGGRVDKANVVMMQLIKMVTFLAEG